MPIIAKILLLFNLVAYAKCVRAHTRTA